MLTYTPTHTHTHRDKVIAISVSPYYVFGVDTKFNDEKLGEKQPEMSLCTVKCIIKLIILKQISFSPTSSNATRQNLLKILV